MVRALILAAPLLILTGCASLMAPPAQEPSPPPAPGALQVPMVGADGRAIGLVTLAEGPKGVLVRLNLLPTLTPPGWHGLHFHEKADCSGAGFTASGSHVGHGGRLQHGLLNPDGPEPGDLPNVLAPAGAGPTIVELYAPGVTLTGARGRMNLMDADGSALVMHAGPDDHVSQPIGGAGARIACAAIGGPEPTPAATP